jgi:hypothetical protein
LFERLRQQRGVDHIFDRMRALGESLRDPEFLNPPQC